MALYEGIALIQEKQAVVLDLGYDYTKFGFTGEAAPRCIVRSEFWCPRRRRRWRLHDYASLDELYDNLVEMLHMLYFRYVLVNPKERKVVVVESLLTPTDFRETLAKVLFLHFEVAGVVMMDGGRLSALATGAPAALVVDLGAREAAVTPVVHGCVVLRALQAGAPGGRALRGELARLLGDTGRPGGPGGLFDHVLEDILVKTCFVIPRSRALAWRAAERGEGAPPAAARGVTWRGAGAGGGGGGGVPVSGRARELAAEVLFARDAELGSLPDLLLQAVMQSPIDVRRALCANILVTGGAAALPGLLPRLRHELRALLLEEPYRSKLSVTELLFHKTGAHVNCVAWAGGAAVGGAASEAAVLSRERYVRARRLADWPSLLDRPAPAPRAPAPALAPAPAPAATAPAAH